MFLGAIAPPFPAKHIFGASSSPGIKSHCPSLFLPICPSHLLWKVWCLFGFSHQVSPYQKSCQHTAVSFCATATSSSLWHG